MRQYISEDNFPAMFGLLAAIVERARHDLQAPDASDVQKIEAREFLDWLTSSESHSPFATGGDDRRARPVIVNRKLRAV